MLFFRREGGGGRALSGRNIRIKVASNANARMVPHRHPACAQIAARGSRFGQGPPTAGRQGGKPERALAPMRGKLRELLLVRKFDDAFQSSATEDLFSGIGDRQFFPECLCWVEILLQMQDAGPSAKPLPCLPFWRRAQVLYEDFYSLLRKL